MRFRSVALSSTPIQLSKALFEKMITPSRTCKLLLVLSTAIATFVVGCNRTPQITSSPETMKCGDALYKALTAQDTRLLDQCETELQRLRDAHEIPPAADDQIRAMIATARGGDWQPATKRLYAFISKQRRPRT